MRRNDILGLDESYDLVGQDGNAYALMGYTSRAMRDAYRVARQAGDEKAMEDFGEEARKATMNKAMSGDYNNLLVTLDDMIRKVNAYMFPDEMNEDDDYDWEQDDKELDSAVDPEEENIQ